MNRKLQYKIRIKAIILIDKNLIISIKQLKIHILKLLNLYAIIQIKKKMKNQKLTINKNHMIFFKLIHNQKRKLLNKKQNLLISKLML